MNKSLLIIYLLLSISLNALAKAHTDYTNKIKYSYYQNKIIDSTLSISERVAYIDSIESHTDKNDKSAMRDLQKEKLDLLYGHGIYSKSEQILKDLIADSIGIAVHEQLFLKYELASCQYYAGKYDKAISNAYQIFNYSKPDSLKYYDIKSCLILGNVYIRLSKTNLARKYGSSEISRDEV